MPACCQAACGEVKPAESPLKAEMPIVPPAAIIPGGSLPAPVPNVPNPPIKAEPKPELPSPPKAGPAEVPAEPRVPSKPDISPIEPVKPTGPAKLPEKPSESPVAPAPFALEPKAPEKPPVAPSPATPTPATPTPATPTPAVPTPAVPNPGAPKPPPKDDPFGNAGNDVKTMRTWTDVSGKYQIEARLVSFQDGTVRLQKANGHYVRIAYNLLCSGDQGFVLNQDQSLLALQ